MSVIVSLPGRPVRLRPVDRSARPGGPATPWPVPAGATRDGRSDVADRSDTDLDVVPLTADEGIALLYRTQWGGLVRLASLLTRDASVAEEIVQDAFVALHRRWGQLADQRAAQGYLRTSVVNGSRSALRHRGVTERHRQPGPPEPAGPEEIAVRSTEDAAVIAALHGLSRRQQEVLVLRYYADLSEEEIAAALGMSRGAVKSHSHRGIATLRKLLGARS